MSAYPYEEPGTKFEDRAAQFAGVPLRSVSTHYFTGVDVALVDFPGQNDDSLDSHGLPVGQAQRRADLLEAACTVDLEVPETVQAGLRVGKLGNSSVRYEIGIFRAGEAEWMTAFTSGGSLSSR